MAARLLLAEPNPAQGSLLQKHLEAQGFGVIRLPDRERAQRRILDACPDLALLCPDPQRLAALPLLEELRERGNTTPVLVLLPSDDYVERVRLLDAGADDVLSRPYAMEELTARVRALIRRSGMGALLADGVELAHKDLLVNTNLRLVTRAGEPVKLTVREYDLLLYLLRHKQTVLPRQQILYAVWGDSWVGNDNLLDVYIRYLRRKIDPPGLEPLIHTVRGVGFCLE
ncbi:two-component response regulator [Cyanobium sp. PCC 7001]|uniref:response regulator transcription factor n=1 Tax=Cyanobium sp. PCC 7001 TaxID=180281 RepID=UPI0001805D22|nr:response regulator transcription factor [Cyanobium sp. PCC 7001]EDY37505.1 two-component response regulator [Cyanobium sp. PCC 7001]